MGMYLVLNFVSKNAESTLETGKRTVYSWSHRWRLRRRFLRWHEFYGMIGQPLQPRTNCYSGREGGWSLEESWACFTDSSHFLQLGIVCKWYQKELSRFWGSCKRCFWVWFVRRHGWKIRSLSWEASSFDIIATFLIGCKNGVPQNTEGAKKAQHKIPTCLFGDSFAIQSIEKKDEGAEEKELWRLCLKLALNERRASTRGSSQR